MRGAVYEFVLSFGSHGTYPRLLGSLEAVISLLDRQFHVTCGLVASSGLMTNMFLLAQ